MRVVAPYPRHRVLASGQPGAWRLALLLVFPVVGLEQVLHTSQFALTSLPVYHALHWLSDSLLALPLAMLAVWSGALIAARLRLGDTANVDIATRAALIALVFAVLLVPGAVLHEAADQLTHAHLLLSIHVHGSATREVLDGPTLLFNYVSHALADGVEGQAVGFPLTLIVLLGPRPKTGLPIRALARPAGKTLPRFSRVT